MEEAFILGVMLGGALAGGAAFLLLRRWRADHRAAIHALESALGRSQIDRAASAREGEAAEALVEGLPTPLYLIDRDALVLRDNAAAIAIAGKEMRGRSLSAGFRQPELSRAVARAIESQSSQEMTLEISVPLERSFLVKIEPLPGAAEPARAGLVADTPAALIMMLDITPIMQTEKFRADFVANVSHELRTPLSSLIGFIETLRGPARDDPAAQERFLAIMQEQADRMFRLISDLLSLSRIEMEEHSAPRGQVDALAVARRVAETLSQKADSLGMTIRIEPFEDPPPVLGDEDQLTQVFQNLIENALKYGGRGTEVLVSGAVAEDVFWISVCDFGSGIPREHLPRLTERFYRVDAARSRELGGTGLGLAIVKHIVNRHRGRLAITSEEGEGSTFRVGLPLGPAPVARASAPDAAKAVQTA